MTGKGRLVRMFRTTSEGCRRTDGQVMTFARVTEELRIIGRDETRTQTASDSSCPPPPKR